MIKGRPKNTLDIDGHIILSYLQDAKKNRVKNTVYPYA